MHSGGAKGADTIWDLEARSVGITNIFHYREPWARNIDSVELRKRGVKPTLLTYEQMADATATTKLVAQKMGRTLSRNYAHYQIRNFYQVAFTDAVYAVSELEYNMRFVKGGTGYAVEMAILVNKPVYVFDQSLSQWFTFDFDETQFVPFAYNVPTLTKNFAGIGTREINPSGIQAIKDIFKHTRSFHAT